MKFFISCITTIVLGLMASAQSRDISGIWEGKLHVSVDLRIVFHFSKDAAGNWTGTMDSPDQNVNGIPCTGVELKGDSLIVQIPSARGKYLGMIVTDSSIGGKWVQGIQIDLVLHKVEKISRLIRPQTPVPPFPYVSEDVEFDNGDKTLHYGATITTPPGPGPFPAVVLITGSGAQDRDETIFEHRPFAVIADYLARRGIIVLRVDDRGMGKSTGSFSKSTSLDFANDVNNSLDYLKTRPKVDTRKLGLIGHSEGGMIAPIVAVQRKDIDFIILLAGPGEKIIELMAEQNAGILISTGINKDAVQSFRDFYPAIPESIVRAKTPEEASVSLDRALKEWIKKTPAAQVLATTGIYNDSSRKKFTETMVGSMYNPWFIYFLSFDPQPWLMQLHCKVLALNGEKDLQVPAVSNLKGIQQALEKSKSDNFEVHAIPGLNHLFQTCKQCTVQEYGQLEETFSPAALQLMGDWIERHIK
jgi:pimeloyl-ACP methyl ester carboxylesterase